MTAPTTSTTTPAPGPAPTPPTPPPSTPTTSETPLGAAKLAVDWAITAGLFIIIYAFLLGRLDMTWTKVLAQGVPVALALTFFARMAGNTVGWNKLCTYFMIAWGVSVLPQLWLGLEDQYTEFLYSESTNLGKAADLAKSKALLNRAADLLPSLSEAREEIYSSLRTMEGDTAEKVKVMLKQANADFKAGVIDQNGYDQRLDQVALWIAQIDPIHDKAIKAVQGPHKDPKLRSRLMNLPHSLWLLFVLGYSIFGFRMASGMGHKFVIAIFGGLLCMYILGAVIPELTTVAGTGSSSFSPELIPVYATCGILLLLSAALLFGRSH